MFQVNDCADSAYNGQFVVDSITKVDGVTGRVLEFTYQVPVIPTDVLENPASATITLDTDTVKSASPYIFNISLRSVYGMCGMEHADGNKAGGFKSMVVAQFTGVSLQKDDKHSSSIRLMEHLREEHQIFTVMVMLSIIQIIIDHHMRRHQIIL